MKEHYYLLSFVTRTAGGLVQACYVRRRAKLDTMPLQVLKEMRMDCPGVSDEAVLTSVSYLGEMTPDEFNGK